MTSTTFKWQTAQTVFGDIPRPMAIIGLRNATGTWQQFTFKIDTGADMTGMNAEDCKLLGYELEEGERVSFDGIGGSQTGHMHKIDMQIGNNIMNKVPVVFSKIQFQNYC